MNAFLKLLSVFAVAVALTFPNAACRSKNQNYSIAEKYPTSERIAADFSEPAVRKLSRYLPLVPEKVRQVKNTKLADGQSIPIVQTTRPAAGFSMKLTRENGSLRAVIVAGSNGRKLVDLTCRESDVSPAEFAAKISTKLFLATNNFTFDIPKSEHALYVDRDDAFGFAFCMRMQRTDWKCIPVRGYSDIPLEAGARKARYLALFSGRRAGDATIAQLATFSIIDLNSGEEIFTISRQKISANDFAELLTQIFAAQDASSAPAERTSRF